MLVSLHSLELLHTHFDRVVAMKDGEIFWQGKAKELNQKMLHELYGAEYKSLHLEDWNWGQRVTQSGLQEFKQRSRLLWRLALPLCCVLVFSIYHLNPSTWLPSQNSQSWASRFSNFFGDFLSPDFSAEYHVTCFKLSLQTFAIACLGMLGGLVGALIIALGASEAVVQSKSTKLSTFKGIRRFVFRELSRFLLDIARGVPDFVWAMMVLFAFGSGSCDWNLRNRIERYGHTRKNI